jgi:hypothetical protein
MMHDKMSWTAKLSGQGITVPQFCFQLVIVTIGVYIAILVQAQSQRRDHIDAASRTLAVIDAELAQSARDISAARAGQAVIRSMLEEVAKEARDAAPDTAISRMVRMKMTKNTTFFSQKAAYTTLIGSGQLEYISEPGLRLQLAQLYEHDYDRLTRNGELIDDVFQHVFRAALLEYWDYARDQPIGTDPNAGVRLSNGALRSVELSTYYEGILAQSLQRISDLQRNIEQYIQRH